VTLDPDEPALAAQPVSAVVDAAVFGPCRAPVRDVMVGGQWIVRAGHHPREDAVLANYRAHLARLSS
jgi:formimidoylglutamate deiminase